MGEILRKRHCVAERHYSLPGFPYQSFSQDKHGPSGVDLSTVTSEAERAALKATFSVAASGSKDRVRRIWRGQKLLSRSPSPWIHRMNLLRSPSPWIHPMNSDLQDSLLSTLQLVVLDFVQGSVFKMMLYCRQVDGCDYQFHSCAHWQTWGFEKWWANQCRQQNASGIS